MQSRSLLLAIVSLIIPILALSGWPRSFAAEQESEVPAWLKAHVGEGDSQIAPLVLQRARELYLQKASDGAIKNPCYFAMDATRPAGFGRRFYVICEADQTFRAVPSGHGSGRAVAGANFTNGIGCAKNFSNAMDSKLTTGGPYVTAEIRTSFKGYYRSAGKYVAFTRSFVQFEGEGDTANARPRAIGGHPAAVLRVACRRKDPDNPYANAEGYVPVGKLQDYAAGRSNGCTSWSQGDAAKIIPMMQEPSTLYIYPDSTDIDAVAKSVKAGKSPSRAGLYWNASCLRAIGAPKFWPKETLEPILEKLKKAQPPPPPARPLPICK